MLSVAEALDAILHEVKPAPPVAVELADALGLITAEAVVSDIDSPPFDKAVMDGFALRSGDLDGAETRLRIVEHVIAGMLPSVAVTSGNATRIMTGAPLPQGADSVVKVEDSRNDPPGPSSVGGTVIIQGIAEPGQNIVRRGASLKVGQTVLPAGRLVRPQEIGALAEVGKEHLSVHARPKVGILATGDELVPVGEQPGLGQIRNSNEAMLGAQTQRAGGQPVLLGIARDNPAELRERIAAGLRCDVLLLSGGVSEGTHDLVPAELAALGVRNVFHKVHLRPGKPLWFGVWKGKPAQAGSWPTYVFGLPGNPVSSLVCFELFVRPCLRRLLGFEPAVPAPVRARLVQEHVAQGERPTYNPARLAWDAQGPRVEPVRWHGSSDLQAMVQANALAVFPGGGATYQPDTFVEVIPFDRSTDGSI
ncbi:MAG TPA: gephyrin-like molybdotransferase Glp [Planctomycetaceae bacterium]|jgi:molybdopterin molybdotransferase|nr:gephyrin-like molybdotransferase Glp [Planctomycetaceae bacterium]